MPIVGVGWGGGGQKTRNPFLYDPDTQTKYDAYSPLANDSFLYHSKCDIQGISSLMSYLYFNNKKLQWRHMDVMAFQITGSSTVA